MFFFFSEVFCYHFLWLYLPLVSGLGCAGVPCDDGRVSAGVALLPLAGLTEVDGVGMGTSPDANKEIPTMQTYKIAKLTILIASECNGKNNITR